MGLTMSSYNLMWGLRAPLIFGGFEVQLVVPEAEILKCRAEDGMNGSAADSILKIHVKGFYWFSHQI